jgi:hypothetical protein
VFDYGSSIVKSLIPALVASLILTLTAETVAQGRHDEKPHGMTAPSGAATTAQPSVTARDPSDQTILLKDGTTLILRADGAMYHADATGKRMRMKDGFVMEGKDGKKYLMKNDVVWQAISQRGTLHPSHP